MDCLGLAGEKPIIPAPPKVCPVKPEPVLPDELVPELDVPVPPVLPLVPPLSLVDPLLPDELVPELDVPVPPVLPLVPPLSLVDPVPLPEVPLVDVEPLPLFCEDEVEVPPEGEVDPPEVVVPVNPLFPPRPLPPLGPTPAIVVALPESGWPKNPIAVGVLFWPYRTGFQSALPVMGSMYLLRRKRMLLVFTRASALGG